MELKIPMADPFLGVKEYSPPRERDLMQENSYGDDFRLPSNWLSSASSLAAMLTPTAICGSDGGYLSFFSRSAIFGRAVSNAFVNECVPRNASSKYALPKYVHSASLLQPKELRSAAEAVITSVSALSSGFTNPPE